MEKAYVYARFSSERQNEASIDAQLRACREYAAAHGIQIIGVYPDEAVSGKGSETNKRKQYQKMLRDVRAGGVDYILVHQYDRIARNLGEHVNLEMKLKESGCRLIAVAQDFGDSKESKIVKAVIWSMSEYYIDNLAFETRKGLRETALKGLHTGGVAPFGYDVVDQRYVVNELEAYYVRKVFAAAAGREGFTRVLAEMNAAGITGKRGKKIKYTQIYEMLRNEKYTGVYAYSVEEEKDRDKRRTKPNAIRIENAIPAIISREEFEEVQKVMKGRKQMNARKEYLCSGLVYCECGAKMHVYRSENKGHTYYYYRCARHCGTKGVPMQEVDDAAIHYLRELLSPETQKALLKAIRAYQNASDDKMGDFKEALAKRIREKQKEYDNLMKNMSAGVLPPTVVTNMGKRMAELETEIRTLQNTEPPEDFTSDQILGWVENIKNAPDEKAVRLLIERIDTKDTTVSSIRSTLNTVVGENGCGDSQHIWPTILFRWP